MFETMIQLRTVLAASLALTMLAAAAGASGDRCTGDCDGDGAVTVDEILAAVTIALDGGSVEPCASADADGDGLVTVAAVVAAVSNALSGCPVAAPTPTVTATATPSPTAGPEAVPTSAAELLAWLQQGNYLGWAAESAAHPSGGPHQLTVRTYINDFLYDSLSLGNTAHPRGAAAVKELYGSSPLLRGWAVSVKVGDDSDGGRGWYWYERVGTSVYASDTGVRLCTGCHEADFRNFASKDFVLIPFPLQ